MKISLDRLTEKDLFGRYLIKAPNGGRFNGYYRSLDVIRPLLDSQEWLTSVTGFYINVAGEFDSVRLSYFTSRPDQTNEVVNRFAMQHKLEKVEPMARAHTVSISQEYGGEELRFRKYLSTYALIGLEIMEADLLNARCLFATFRWQVMRARQPYRPHFITTFESQSSFYNSLLNEQKEQFWQDLAHWPNPPQVDWAHLFVNMVLGCDWNGPKIWPMFLTQQPALTIQEIS